MSGARSVNVPGNEEDRSWWRLYGLLAFGTATLVVLFGSIVGLKHVLAIIGVGLCLPPLLACMGRWWHPPAANRGELGNSAGPTAWFAMALFGVATAKFLVLGVCSSQFIPALHDEWSYVFGAETIALGRLANPSPPVSEFFDAFHILTIPRWVTRYPPGHPAALAIGVLVGWPAAIVVLLSAGTTVWVYCLARELGGESVGRVAGILAVMAPGMDYLASGYLSQSTLLFTMTGCYTVSIWAVRRDRVAWSILAGLMGGWALLTRPYSAAALGMPLAVWFLATTLRPRSGRPLLLLASAVVPLLLACGLLLVYNAATTGEPLGMAWAEYNRQFEPDNTLGFSRGVSRPIPGGITERKQWRAQSIAGEKLAFTWQAALRRSATNPARLEAMLFSGLGFLGLAMFAPFAWRGIDPCRDRSLWLLLAAPVVHYVAYSLFYSNWGVYGHETVPFVVLLVAAGMGQFWRLGRQCDRPTLAVLVPITLGLAIAADALEIARFIPKRRQETQYHREFAAKISQLEGPAVVFVKLGPGKPREYDLIHNDPSLAAPVLIVLDHGARNVELLRRFPGRQAYLYDEPSSTLEVIRHPN